MASLTLEWLQLAALVGALQGLLLTGVLVAQRSNRTANRLLAALMAAFTVFLASGVYFTTGAFRSFPHFFGAAYLMPWVFGPLVYLYAVAASDREWRFQRRTWLHFAPVAVIFLLSIPNYLSSGAEKIALFDRWVVSGPPQPFVLIDPTKYISGIGYTVATILYLRRHRRQVEQSYSNTERVNLRWLLRLAAAAGIIWAMAVTLRVAGVRTPIRDSHVSFAIAILVYSIGYRGLRQTEVFRYQTAEYPVQRKRPDAPPPELETTERYERSGLNDIEAAQLKGALLAVMDKDQPWKNSELTLADLAERLNTSPHKLSEVLNAQIGQTFYDFVNGYRVREVQRRIKAGEARALKILALALDAGFSSKSTFYQAFKKHTSQTPSDFREAVGM